MSRNFDSFIQTYRWTPYNKDKNFGNELPFQWRCACGTITEVLDTDATKEYECDNPKCPWKLKFVM